MAKKPNWYEKAIKDFSLWQRALLFQPDGQSPTEVFKLQMEIYAGKKSNRTNTRRIKTGRL